MPLTFSWPLLDFLFIWRAPFALLYCLRNPNILHRASGHAIGCSPRPTWLAPRAPVGYLPLSLPDGANPSSPLLTHPPRPQRGHISVQNPNPLPSPPPDPSGVTYQYKTPIPLPSPPPDPSGVTYQYKTLIPLPSPPPRPHRGQISIQNLGSISDFSFLH